MLKKYRHLIEHVIYGTQQEQKIAAALNVIAGTRSILHAYAFLLHKPTNGVF